jgi:hypothetical protein
MLNPRPQARRTLAALPAETKLHAPLLAGPRQTAMVLARDD